MTHYEAKPFVETFHVGEVKITLDHENRLVFIDEDIMLPYDQIPDIVQFLAWAMRTRMQEETKNEGKAEN